MIHNKKAQGISINAIIIAVIALVVLVVLVAVFTGKFGELGIGLKKASGDITKNCEDPASNNGHLKPVDECRTAGGQVLASKNAGGDQVCCTK